MGQRLLQRSLQRCLQNWCFLPVLLLCAMPCRGAAPERSRAELSAEAVRLETVVQACGASGSACRQDAVPEDEQLRAEAGQPKRSVPWGWLRDALSEASHASAEDRGKAMRASAGRLEEIAQEAGGGPAPAGEKKFSEARRTADRVLARQEFGTVEPPGPWERFKAKLGTMLARLFAGVGRLGARAPWLGILFEWLFFAAAATGLLLFVWRNFQRQRLAASLRVGEAAQSAWDREATDWAVLAETAAGSGEWREAVHCLYWAAIVRLEGKRLWRHNPARTPREYVRLLKPGTVQRESLGGLTGLLERVWYGLRPAAAEDYQRARGWFDRLTEAGTATGNIAGNIAGSERV